MIHFFSWYTLVHVTKRKKQLTAQLRAASFPFNSTTSLSFELQRYVTIMMICVPIQFAQIYAIFLIRVLSRLQYWTVGSLDSLWALAHRNALFCFHITNQWTLAKAGNIIYAGEEDLWTGRPWILAGWLACRQRARCKFLVGTAHGSSEKKRAICSNWKSLFVVAVTDTLRRSRWTGTN